MGHISLKCLLLNSPQTLRVPLDGMGLSGERRNISGSCVTGGGVTEFDDWLLIFYIYLLLGKFNKHQIKVLVFVNNLRFSFYIYLNFRSFSPFDPNLASACIYIFKAKKYNKIHNHQIKWLISILYYFARGFKQYCNILLKCRLSKIENLLPLLF